jgi:hypothetical protein
MTFPQIVHRFRSGEQNIGTSLSANRFDANR